MVRHICIVAHARNARVGALCPVQELGSRIGIRIRLRVPTFPGQRNISRWSTTTKLHRNRLDWYFRIPGTLPNHQEKNTGNVGNAVLTHDRIPSIPFPRVYLQNISKMRLLSKRHSNFQYVYVGTSVTHLQICSLMMDFVRATTLRDRNDRDEGI